MSSWVKPAPRSDRIIFTRNASPNVYVCGVRVWRIPIRVSQSITSTEPRAVDRRSFVLGDRHHGRSNLVARLPGLCFGEPDARDLGIAERHAGNDPVVARARPAEDVVDDEPGLVRPHVREQKLARRV